MLQDGQKGVIIQRDKQTYAVAPHTPCGLVTPGILRKIADVAEKYNASSLKITSAARIAIIGIKEEDVDSVWAELGMDKGSATGLCVRSVKACPGTSYCKRGMQDSLSLGLKLDEKYHGMELPGKMKIGVSGCPNQCAESGVKDIGIVGFKAGFRLFVGGSAGGRVRIAEEIARDLTQDEVIKAVREVVEYYKANAKAHQRLGSLIEKTGIDGLKKAVSGESGEPKTTKNT